MSMKRSLFAVWKRVIWGVNLLIILLGACYVSYICGQNSVAEVCVTVQEAPPPAPGLAEPVPNQEEVTFPLNLNTASAQQLEQLPGIGPKLAARIVAYRTEIGPFLDKRQIMDVEGIGEKKFAELEQLIVVEELHENFSGG